MNDEEKKPETENFIEQIVNKEINLEKDSSPKNYSKQLMPTGIIIGFVVFVGMAAFFAGLFFSNLDSDQITKSDLDDAISRLESKMVNNLSIQAKTQPQPAQSVKISLDDDPIRGDPNAPISIIEFSDYQCPFCARFYTQTLPLLKEEYIDQGKVNFVYRDFPIQSIHPNALPAAVAAECADDQNKYWEYHDILFERQDSWAKQDSDLVMSTFSQYATDIGLEQGQFDTCLGSGKYLQEVQNDLNDGRNYEVTGTPGFFIGNEKIGFAKLNGAQPFDSFKKIIDSQLNP